MNKCTRVRALRSCSGDVHVARVVVSLVVHAVVWSHAWSHCLCCCRRFRRSLSVANFSVFGGIYLYIQQMVVQIVGRGVPQLPALHNTWNSNVVILYFQNYLCLQCHGKLRNPVAVILQRLHTQFMAPIISIGSGS